MVCNIHQEGCVPETEKLTVNLTPVDLGRIELLVEQGFYANRAEFIRTAISSWRSMPTPCAKPLHGRDSSSERRASAAGIRGISEAREETGGQGDRVCVDFT
jgi:Arc/MetJ-type ribon-helix-helix transcriptional regulator